MLGELVSRLFVVHMSCFLSLSVVGKSSYFWFWFSIFHWDGESVRTKPHFVFILCRLPKPPPPSWQQKNNLLHHCTIVRHLDKKKGGSPVTALLTLHHLHKHKAAQSNIICDYLSIKFTLVLFQFTNRNQLPVLMIQPRKNISCIYTLLFHFLQKEQASSLRVVTVVTLKEVQHVQHVVSVSHFKHLFLLLWGR